MSGSTTGLALRALREQSGLTARQLAARAGVSESYLSRVENGRVTAEPSWIGNVAAAIAAAILEAATATGPQRVAVAS